MIIDAIGSALLAAMTWLVSLLPTGELLDGLDDFGGIWIGYAQWNTWLPLSELLVCIVGIVGVQLMLYGYLALRAVRGWLPIG
jgi:hypothetical protein